MCERPRWLIHSRPAERSQVAVRTGTLSSGRPHTQTKRRHRSAEGGDAAASSHSCPAPAAPHRSSPLLALIPFYCVLNSQPGYALFPPRRLLLPRSGASFIDLVAPGLIQLSDPQRVLKKKKKWRRGRSKKDNFLENLSTVKVRMRPRRSIYTCATCDPLLHFHAVAQNSPEFI